MKNEIHPNLYEVDVIDGTGHKIKLWYPLNQTISITSSRSTHNAWNYKGTLENKLDSAKKRRVSIYADIEDKKSNLVDNVE